MSAPTNISDWVRGIKRHQFYKDTCDHYEDLLVHADGVYPKKLIEERRPGESDTIKKYREQIYIPKTQPPFGKVLSSLMKIRKATDYSIRFDSTKIPAKINSEETPEEYLMKDFPRYESIDNWFWSVCFKQMIVDPNGISLIWNLNPERPANEYAKPYPVIYNSPQILDYVEDEYYFLKSNETATYRSGNRDYPANVFVYVDKEVIAKYTQSNSRGDYAIEEYPHGLTELPVVRLNGVSYKDTATCSLYHSRLGAMLPELKEAVREYSDMQASIVQHMFPTMWFYGAQECGNCKGAGMIPVAEGAPVKCVKCGGRGKYPFNPYENIEVSSGNIGEQPAPTPPAAYIQKDTAIVELQDKRVQDHIYYGLSAINMEFLANVPQQQSGIAKEFDRSDLNNFVYSVAEDCVRCMDHHIDIINQYRYNVLITDPEVLSELAPRIDVPVQYDLITDQMMTQEISRMKDAKFNQRIIAAAEIEYVGRKFITNDALRDMVIAEYDLDPLSGIPEEDITMRLTNNGISKKDYIIHCNIKGFIEKLIDEDPTYLSLDKIDQRDKLEALADQFVTDNAQKAAVANGRIAPVIPLTPTPTPAPTPTTSATGNGQ